MGSGFARRPIHVWISNGKTMAEAKVDLLKGI
jgi:hypothetical protein